MRAVMFFAAAMWGLAALCPAARAAPSGRTAIHFTYVAPDLATDRFGGDDCILAGTCAPVAGSPVVTPTTDSAFPQPAVGPAAQRRLTLGPPARATLPEPAEWALMLGGLGAISGVVRRRLRVSEQDFKTRIERIAAGEPD